LILEVFAFSSSFNKIAVGEDDRCLHVALPVVAFLQMLTQPVTTRTVSSTHAIFGSDYFPLAGLVLSRKHGHVRFVHKRLE